MGEEKISITICVLTFDVETHFLFDGTCVIPDSVASLICTRDSTEGDAMLIDTDATLVALPECPWTGQQHQSGSATGEVGDDDFTSTVCLSACTSEQVNVCWLYLDVRFASTALGLYSKVIGGVILNSEIW